MGRARVSFDQARRARLAAAECGGEKRATCDALEIDYKTLMRHLG